ncbi:hypothetical protein I79_008107 [Cricetulus griseus]|uniref:Uncharacterized protein n=1 Tax=Cricetulus griseus TaxID=10029 RepID=G3HCA1_CRIGR|nr:hypothetical protein I79_008107 [Cricetulus griseus]
MTQRNCGEGSGPGRVKTEGRECALEVVYLRKPYPQIPSMGKRPYPLPFVRATAITGGSKSTKLQTGPSFGSAMNAPGLL